MNQTNSKWLAYTVLVGLIPMIARFAAWGTTKLGGLHPLAAADIIVFGLVLHISNINELEHPARGNASWRTIQNGLSVFFIALYSVLYALILVSEAAPELLDAGVMLRSAGALAVASFSLSVSIFHRLSQATK